MRKGHWSGMMGAVILLGMVADGCHKPKSPPLAYQGATLACAELGLEPVRAEPTDFVILQEQTSQGLFPTALAVARLKPPSAFFVPVTEDPNRRNWRIDRLKPQEAVYWNKLFNTVTSISQVVVLDDRCVAVPDADLEGILEAARKARAGLCLVYGHRAADEENAAALAGVILNTSSGQALAYVQAQAGPEDFEPPALDRLKQDRRHMDPNYLAARKFEQNVFRGMIRLMAKDRPATTTQPNPWKGHANPEVQNIIIMPNQPMGR